MTIQSGDQIPEATLFEMGEDGPGGISTNDLFGDKTVVMFGIPGAFTPTCSAQHLPGFVNLADQIKSKGVDEIVCFAVNDPFVMAAWAKDVGVDGKVRLVADGNGELTTKMGLELDISAAGLGTRCERFAMVVENGTVKSIDIEGPGEFEISSAEAQLSKL
jgi:peroxiredoxin